MASIKDHIDHMAMRMRTRAAQFDNKRDPDGVRNDQLISRALKNVYTGMDALADDPDKAKECFIDTANLLGIVVTRLDGEE